MYKKSPQLNFITICLTSFLCLFASGLTMRVLAEDTIPPVEDSPGGRESGTVRNDCKLNGEHLTALIPLTQNKTALGLTSSAYPTFFFYIPHTKAQSAEFILYDENDKEVYLTNFSIENNLSGVVSISIPPALSSPTLKVKKSYRWVFSLECNAEDPSGNEWVDGWIQRVSLSQNRVTQLENASNRDRLSVYTQEGIWFDALTVLAELRRENPNDTMLIDNWEKLLKDVGLAEISQKPILSP